MAYEFMIDFFGICAFVRNDKWDRVDVILPKTTPHGMKCQASNHSEVPRHEARLLVNAENLNRPIDEFFDRHVSLPGGHWLSGPLDGYMLTIAGAKPHALKVFKGLRPEGPGADPCPNYDSADISWLADMELACGDGTVNIEVLTKNLNVAARVKLTEGSLQCSQLTRSGDSVDKYSFESVAGKNKYLQALAESLRYTVALKGEPALVLTRHPEKGGGPNGTSREGSGRGDFELPLNSVAGAPVRVAVSHLPEKFTDDPYDHFHAFYSLNAVETPHNVPRSAGSCPVAPKISDLTNWPKICPAALFYTKEFPE
jgi:hypothetical protein